MPVPVLDALDRDTALESVARRDLSVARHGSIRHGHASRAAASRR